MKKILKISGIFIGILLALILTAAILIPLLFKDKLIGLAKDTANKNLNATVDFKSLNISILRNFPDMTVSINDFSITGVDKFKSDTLASASSLKATVNLMSYLRKNIIDIQSVEIIAPHVHAKVSDDGDVNWDVMKPSESATPEKPEEGESSFNMSIKKFEIKQGAVMYEDLSSKLLFVLKDLNFSMTGNMSDKITELQIETSADNLNLFSDGIMRLSNMFVSVAAGVDADLDKMIFSFNGAEININRIALLADGTVKMPDDDIDIDLTYRAKVPSLKTLLEMIPASMLADVNNVDMRGEMSLSGWVKGIYNDKSTPNVWTELGVKNGYIKYNLLPKSIDNINIDSKIFYDGNDDKNTKIDINRFHFELSNNPFDLTAKISEPLTDADIKASVKGRIDFASITEALPLEGVNLNGTMNADIKFEGRMSNIEKEQYDKLNLEGSLALKNFVAKVEGIAVPMDAANAELVFSPRFVELKDLNCKLGESDFRASGRLDNVMNYALKNETLKGDLQLSSNYVNCNQLTSAVESEQAAETDAGALSVIVLPSNVDLSMNANIKKILYDNLTLANAVGKVGIKGGALEIDNLKADFAGGTINMTGKYKAENISSAHTEMNMSLKNIEIRDLASNFQMFDKILPVLTGLGGKVSFDFKFSDMLDQNMSPVLPVLNAVGSLNADSLRIVNADMMNRITSLIGLKETSNVLKDIKASFSVSDGKVGLKPFSISAGGNKMTIGGEYGLDQLLNAHIDMQIPAEKLTGAINNLISQIGGKPGTMSDKINVGIAVGGSPFNPTFKLTAPKYMTDADGTSSSHTVKDEITEQAKQIIDDKTKELEHKVEEKVQDVIQEQLNKAGIDKDPDQAVDKLKDLFKKKQ